MDRCSGVLAALHLDHEQSEEQEERSHGEADAVHGPVAHQHVTVDVAPHTRKRRAHAVLTEAWNLSTGTEVMLPVASESACTHTHTHLLQLLLHARHQHNTGHTHSQQQEEGVDEAGHRGVVSTRAATAQQTGGATAQTWDLKNTNVHTQTVISSLCVCACVCVRNKKNKNKQKHLLFLTHVHGTKNLFNFLKMFILMLTNE